MLSKEKHRIGDSWYYVEDNRVHVFFLNCPYNVEPHTAWNIDHAVSSDLVHWTHLGTILENGAYDEWDHNLATGSVLKVGSSFWLAYTGRWNGPGTSVGLAVSDDLYNWRKIEENPITQIDERFYEKVGSGRRGISHWRDPFLFEEEGTVYHYVCASRNDGPKNRRGTLGLARCIEPTKWEILPPPLIEPMIEELECPQVRQIDGRYYLIFSSHPDFFPASSEFDRDKLRQSTYSMVADSVFGPFRFLRTEPILPAAWPVQPYAGQIVQWRGKNYLLGTDWFTKEHDFIPDPIPIRATETGLVAEE